MKYNIDDLILLNMAGIGYRKLKAVIDHSGSMEEALRIFNIKKDKERLKREWALIKKRGVSLLSLFDEAYPKNLKEIYSPPIILYVKGKILPQDETAVAVVGSRKASIYGLNIGMSFSGELANLGITVISGLARGIDSAAHKGALKNGGRTLAVLGNGLNTLYPPENIRMAEEISYSGALISEFPMERPPLPRNFPIRNRIISGASLGVVIVEAAEKSGALITATSALEQGREVFAVPGKAGATTSTGTHRLIKDGAKLIENVDDIVEELNLGLIPFDKPGIDALPNDRRPKILDGPEKKIYEILSDEPEHIDNIIDKSRLPAREVMSLLLGLEVRRLIKQLPGKNFVK